MTERPPHTKAIVEMSAAIERAITTVPVAAFEIICAVMEDGRAGLPLTVLGDAAEQADIWVAYASTIEMEAFLVAISSRLAETEMHSKTRKRLLAKLFSGMAKHDQAAFITWAEKQRGEKS
jgi:hypothetical protein